MKNSKVKKFIFVLILVVMLILSTSASAGNTPVSINVVNEDVKVVLYTLATISNTNIIVDDDVTGTVTMSINNVSFNAALDAIAKVKGYSYQINNGTVFFGTAKIVPGELFVFKLQNARAEEVFASVAMTVGFDAPKIEKKSEGGGTSSSSSSSSSSSGGVSTGVLSNSMSGIKTLSVSNATCSLNVDVLNNAIVFRGGRSDADRIRDMLNVLDMPQKQVSIQAELVSMTKTDSAGLGIEWNWSKFSGDLAIGSGQFSSGSMNITAQIDALITSGKAKLMARPNIMTSNGKPGIINVGKEIPLITEITQTTNTDPGNNNQQAYSVDRVQTGIVLQFIPRINQDNTINVEIYVEESVPEQVVLINGVNDYTIYKRTANTSLQLKNGETIVIGGLIRDESTVRNTKVWALGDLPIIGWLFKGTDVENADDELVIFVTAKVVE
ncbi:MAG: secretin and TonB N-terminal domain-containing protein [Negativicutes bacterium]